MKEILEKIALNPQQNHYLLIDLVNEIRPPRHKKGYKAISQIENLIALLYTYPKLKEGLAQYWTHLTQKRTILRLLTDLGLQSNLGFLTETSSKITQRILPELQNENSFVHLLKAVFYKRRDYLWVSEVPDVVWMRLLETMGLKPVWDLEKNNIATEQILNAFLIISLRITTIGLDPEMVERLPELEKFGSPFLAQNEEVDRYITKFRNEPDFDRSTENSDYKQIMVMLTQCDEYIKIIRKSRENHGISLGITYMLLRLSQNIAQLKVLLSLLVKNEEVPHYKGEVLFMKNAIKSSNQKDSIAGHISNSLSLLAFQMTEYAGKVGGQYITSTRKEYWKMLRSATWGGFIVAFLCVIKNSIYYLQLAPFGRAVFHSSNYSLGFITIYASKSVLAAKQPSMTASSIAQSLDTRQPKETHYAEKFSILTSKIARSQFIAAVGNVLIAFPVAFIIALVYYFLAQEHIADAERAQMMVSDLHPIRSYALFHAAIAGVYLFLTGLISGYYDNKNVSNQIPKRIQKHPFLNRFLPKKWIQSFADYIEKHLGSLAGNFYLGVFLGCTGIAGEFLGLPLDIQHVSFAAGNLGISIVCLDNQLGSADIFISMLGVLGIGFMNFTVSFGLALTVAMQSRRVNFREIRKIFVGLRKFFVKKPMGFFFPPKEVQALSEKTT